MQWPLGAPPEVKSASGVVPTHRNTSISPHPNTQMDDGGLSSLRLDDFSFFGPSPANTTILEDVKSRYSAYVRRIALLNILNGEGQAEPVKPRILWPHARGLDASPLALLDAAYIEFQIGEVPAVNEEVLVVGSKDDGGQFNAWGALAAEKAQNYLLGFSSASENIRKGILFIADAIAETISNALHCDGVENEFCCPLGQGRQWTLAVTARRKDKGLEIAFAVVTGGATIPAVMVRRYHGGAWTDQTRSVKNFREFTNLNETRNKKIEKKMVNIAINPNPEVRNRKGQRVDSLGNGLKNIRADLSAIASLSGSVVSGYVISDRSVCNLWSDDLDGDFEILRLDADVPLDGTLLAVRVELND